MSPAKTKILVTGGTGLVGSRIAEVLSSSYLFENISRSTGVDITDVDQTTRAIAQSSAQIVLHLAAKANVDQCEEDKIDGETGEAWKINVLGTKHVVMACEKAKKTLMYLSTDFVFPGDQQEGAYSEEDTVSPINWYGMTKAKAEEIIQQASIKSLIIRPAFPYTYIANKPHFIAAIYNRLAKGDAVTAVVDEFFTPTWLDDLATAIDVLIQNDEEGIYHVGGATRVSPYDVALAIADVWRFDKQLISKTTREQYFAGKAPRPFNTSLKSDKIQKLGVYVSQLSFALQKIKSTL